jgi:hypothetical protein
MRINAGDLSSLLRLDLEAAGWTGALSPYPGQVRSDYAMTSLFKSLTKKYLEKSSTQGTTPEGDAAALSLFLRANSHCKDFDQGAQPRTEIEEIALGEAQAFLYDFFYPKARKSFSEDQGASQPVYLDRDFVLSDREISLTVGCGPGASVGAKATDFYTKLATSRLTFTDPSLLLYYRQIVRHHPTWNECEVLRSTKVGERTVRGSRLSFVPKTAVISRTICTEPILNMFFQKGIEGALKRRMLEVIGIDLSIQQPKNSQLARLGSISGEFGTIDLSSASDTLSISTIKRYFPQRVYDVLMRYRSPRTILPDGSEIDLHMVSSMGNAFTFPLQTLFFSALVMGAYRALDIRVKKPRGPSETGNFAVYGDDIIVLERSYKLLTRLLFLTGFTVNHDKSFNEGLFRESCGQDFYSGYNVRGVYIQSLNDANDLYSAINRLNRWSARHRIFLNNLVSYLSSKCRFLPIPFDEDDSCGIKIPFAMLSNVQRRYVPNRGVFYRYSKIATANVQFPPIQQSMRNQLGYFDNPAGLLLAFVAGYIRNGSVGYRVDRRRANIRKRYTPRWDYITFACGESRECAEDWKVFCTLNLCN